jgi:hypothetical protein
MTRGVFPFASTHSQQTANEKYKNPGRSKSTETGAISGPDRVFGAVVISTLPGERNNIVLRFTFAASLLWAASTTSSMTILISQSNIGPPNPTRTWRGPARQAAHEGLLTT